MPFHKIKIKYLILFLIILLASTLRLYRIREYIVFLGDEGRDVLVVKRMIVDKKFTLLGPITSVGSIYMGPVYYYFMAPFLWLWKYDPVGPAIMVVLFSIATVYMIYKSGNDYFHPAVGLIAAFLYSVSRLPIFYGRTSWNPNIVPFFSVIIIYSLLKIVIDKKSNYLILVGLCLGILIQLHYVTLLMIPVILSCLAIIKFKLKLKYYLLSLVAFITAYSPFILFEIRHSFVNSQAVWKFFWQQKSESSNSIISVFMTIYDVLTRLFWRLIIVENAEITKLFIIGLVLVCFHYWKMNKNKENIRKSILVITIWLILGIVSFGLYRGVIYDYYFGSLFPAPYLLTGVMLYTLWRQGNLYKHIAGIIFSVILIFNIKNSPLAIEPNNLLKNTETISKFIFDKVSNKPYNFALIAGQNSDHAYRYFLEIWGNPPVTIENPQIDPQRKSVTGNLFVICEEKICQPLGHSLWEIAGFGRAEIVNEWQVSTAKVFQLTRYLGPKT